MKRFFTITIIIIAVIGIFLVISWFFARQTAQKNGTKPQTFREFVTGTSSPSSQTTTTPSTTSSVFTQEQETQTAGETQSVVTRSSIFTNTEITPNIDSAPTQQENNSTVGTSTGANSTVVGQTSSDTTPICGDADVTITFTPDELVRLKALQNRFYAVADTLYTDANVATEKANYDSFIQKIASINGLYNYCESHRVAVDTANPTFKNRVITPFWYDPAIRGTPAQAISYTTPGQPITILGQPILTVGPNEALYGEKVLQKYLRINLW